MTIRDWDGVALIIGAGGIGKCMSDYLTTISPKLDVFVCGRNLKSQNAIYLDLDNDHSFISFENKISLFNKPLRLVINTSGFLHSTHLKPEKRLSHISRSNIIKNFSINSIAPILIAKSIEKFIRPELPFSYASLSARVGSIGDNRLGGWYSYRASKAAQNQFLKTLSIECVENSLYQLYLSCIQGLVIRNYQNLFNLLFLKVNSLLLLNQQNT